MKNSGSRTTTTIGCSSSRRRSVSTPRGRQAPRMKPPNTAWMPMASIAHAHRKNRAITQANTEDGSGPCSGTRAASGASRRRPASNMKLR